MVIEYLGAGVLEPFKRSLSCIDVRPILPDDGTWQPAGTTLKLLYDMPLPRMIRATDFYETGIKNTRRRRQK